MPRPMSHIIVSVVFHYPDSVNQITTTHIIDNVDAIIRQHSSAVSVIFGYFNKMKDLIHFTSVSAR